MNDECDNSLAIAELADEFRGKFKAVRSEIEAILARNEAMEAWTGVGLAEMRKETAQRETPLIHAMAGMNDRHRGGNHCLSNPTAGTWLGAKPVVSGTRVARG